MESKKLATISLSLAIFSFLFPFGLNLFYNSLHPYSSLILDDIFGFGTISLALFAIIFGVVGIIRVTKEASSQKVLIIILSFLGILIGLYATLITFPYYITLGIGILKLTGYL